MSYIILISHDNIADFNIVAIGKKEDDLQDKGSKHIFRTMINELTLLIEQGYWKKDYFKYLDPLYIKLFDRYYKDKQLVASHNSSHNSSRDSSHNNPLKDIESISKEINDRIIEELSLHTEGIITDIYVDDSKYIRINEIEIGNKPTDVYKDRLNEINRYNKLIWYIYKKNVKECMKLLNPNNYSYTQIDIENKQLTNYNIILLSYIDKGISIIGFVNSSNELHILAGRHSIYLLIKWLLEKFRVINYKNIEDPLGYSRIHYLRSVMENIETNTLLPFNEYNITEMEIYDGDNLRLYNQIEKLNDNYKYLNDIGFKKLIRLFKEFLNIYYSYIYVNGMQVISEYSALIDELSSPGNTAYTNNKKYVIHICKKTDIIGYE